MTKFEAPEIMVVKFGSTDVITTSSGYEDNSTERDFAYNIVEGGNDSDFPL